jgi:hypothetical protein
MYVTTNTFKTNLIGGCIQVRCYELEANIINRCRKISWAYILAKALSSSTFPSKSHVPSINRDEVTLFQVRPICCDLRIFLPLTQVSCGRYSVLWGVGPPETVLTAKHSRTTYLLGTIKWTHPNYSTALPLLMFHFALVCLTGDLCCTNYIIIAQLIKMQNMLKLKALQAYFH